MVSHPNILTPYDKCGTYPSHLNYQSVYLQKHKPFPIQFFCQPHTPQLLFILGRKEVGGILVITITCSHQNTWSAEKHIEYNLRYLLAKVRTT